MLKRPNCIMVRFTDEEFKAFERALKHDSEGSKVDPFARTMILRAIKYGGDGTGDEKPKRTRRAKQ